MQAIVRALILLVVVKPSCLMMTASEANLDSVCFNNCSEHGTCKDFVCECDIGYEGDDCRFCFAGEGEVVPILSAGHMNLTLANFADALREARTLVVVASSRSCHKCIRYEPEYKAVTATLEGWGMRLGRIDADEERQLLRDLLDDDTAATQHLPIVAVFMDKRKSKALLFEGPHERHAITEFARKQVDLPTRRLRSVAEVEAFVQNPQNGDANTPTAAVAVVGFFSDPDEMEEDEMEDFMDACIDLKPRFDLYFGVVDDAAVSEHFKKLGWILRTPEVFLKRSGVPQGLSLSLRELLENNASIKDWVIKESVPLVGCLTHGNFAQYERIGSPMLIMFLELPEHAPIGPGTSVGGKSGGVSNSDLIRELETVALEHRGRFSFLYADGVTFADSMKTLGLFGNRERLPQVGFNTRDGRQLPFPEDLPINRETLLQFCAAFLSGRLQRSQDARKAMVSAAPYSAHNTVRRKKKRKPPPEVPGISEQIKPQDAIVQVTRNTFELEVMDEVKDVILLLYSKECESCSHVAPYYKRVGERFKDLDISSVKVAAMDATEESPPPDLGITLPPLPAIVLLPAQDKGPPFRFFSGIGKVGPIMRWVQKHASIGFDLPVLPHLSEQEKPLFREQVRRREELQATKKL